jgi:hypothetical protein
MANSKRANGATVTPADGAPTSIAIPHHAALQRIRAEYLEMPGLQLTREQAGQLCGVERALCRIVLDALVVQKFLCVTSDGRYTRLGDGECRRHPARAHLRTSQPSLKAS